MTNLSWIFYQEIPVPHDVQELLISGEVAERAFRTVRDVAIFTNKRLIVKDVQGLTGSKAKPDMASQFYDDFNQSLSTHVPVERGRFGADMQVSLINDGPVTIILDTKNR